MAQRSKKDNNPEEIAEALESLGDKSTIDETELPPQSDIDELQAQVDELKAKVETLEADMASLKEDVTRLYEGAQSNFEIVWSRLDSIESIEILKSHLRASSVNMKPLTLSDAATAS